MCNAHNHPTGCDCGWGGYGNSGGGSCGRGSTTFRHHGRYPSTVYVSGNSARWTGGDDFCRSTTCPICKAEVFFVRHNGGSVWFDSLGHPWPKHKCFVAEDRQSITFRERYQSARKSEPLSIIGRVNEVRIDPSSDSCVLRVATGDGIVRDYAVHGFTNPFNLVGELIVIIQSSGGQIEIVHGTQ